MGKTWDRLLQTLALRRWKRLAGTAEQASLPDLRAHRTEARALRNSLDRLIHAADGRLALPAIGSSHFFRPHGTDWSWRPAPWRGPLPIPGISPIPDKFSLSDDVKLFHDSANPELTLRQVRNRSERDLAPFGLRLDAFHFDGSFLSLVVDLPKEACDGLSLFHLVRVDTVIEQERPSAVLARLNIAHGPNVEQLVLGIPERKRDASLEFDLACSRINDRRINGIWLDLILETPRMNQIILRDLTFARYPRAAL
ncbi:DUF6478 family protein [Sedimentitalea sp. JM2-8]|uniref:DUF6478 family protein n=1 Tax=Sedimentitalea xiamensis TaxID=3050037 RepID=A0ABT7F8R4_9RHOB|nr:DUF6478 family protein [Sedimentitalea xiamensis]MDK3071499.1 DUF6478 family protein [Sedimentitalea xiamensis]